METPALASSLSPFAGSTREASVPDPVALPRYQPGDFYLRTARGRMLARGVFARVAPIEGDLATGANAWLAEAARHLRRPLVVGAVGFHASTPPALIVPVAVSEPGVWRPGPIAPARARAVRPVPPGAEYARAVDLAHARLNDAGLRKVVLARALDIEADPPLDPRLVLAELERRNPHGFVFAADLPSGDGPRTIVGASPELLLSRRGLKIVSNPLAGSVARSADPAEDRARAEALVRSEKDRHEHALVIEMLAQRLAPYCRRLSVPRKPSLLRTPTLWHLSTRITGQLTDRGLSSLALALALHPTPAVCGSPTDVARTLIGELEPFPRGYYSGLVGWCDAQGDGEWAVTLRCAELAGATARLYAGAGVVRGSRGASELAETEVKLGTMLDALALGRLPAGGAR